MVLITFYVCVAYKHSCLLSTYILQVHALSVSSLSPAHSGREGGREGETVCVCVCYRPGGSLPDSRRARSISPFSKHPKEETESWVMSRRSSEMERLSRGGEKEEEEEEDEDEKEEEEEEDEKEDEEEEEVGGGFCTGGLGVVEEEEEEEDGAEEEGAEEEGAEEGGEEEGVVLLLLS